MTSVSAPPACSSYRSSVAAATKQTMARCTSLAVPYVREHSRMLILFVASAFFWMLAPGTLLALLALAGVSFSGHASFGWIQAHAHAQLFGWAGTLILGVSLYAIPRLRRTDISSRTQMILWCVWTVGVALRWLAAMLGAADLLLISAFLELAAGSAAFLSVLAGRGNEELSESLDLVVISAFGFVAALMVNLLGAFAAFRHESALITGSWNHRVLSAFLWAAIVPTIFAYTIRWVAPMLTLRRSVRPLFVLSICGVIASLVVGELSSVSGAIARLAAIILFIAALRVFEPFEKTPKTKGVSPATPFFVRMAFVWLLVSLAIDTLSATILPSILNAAKHALALGFIASMILVVAPRFLPAFFGAKELFNARLMTISLVVHHVCVAVRVIAESGLIVERQRALLITGSGELLAFTLFAMNIVLTVAITKRPDVTSKFAASSPTL
jgi:uncharacterized protein involved in response to NO